MSGKPAAATLSISTVFAAVESTAKPQKLVLARHFLLNTKKRKRKLIEGVKSWKRIKAGFPCIFPSNFKP